MKQLDVNIRKQLKNFSLEIEFSMNQGCLGILGSSGCGKSVTLKNVAGILTPDKGKICTEKKVLYDSRKKVNLSPQKRKVGYLFQNYALFPNMTVEENIAAGVRKDCSNQKEMICQLVKKFQLEGLEHQYPGKLSGGQQQRTALARILASQPELFLLDEPFSALDAYLKEELQMEMKRQIESFEGCTILVSHDRDEIYRMCRNIMIMDQGKNLICGETKKIFQHPVKMMAARLTGCKNISPAVQTGAHQVYAEDWGVFLTVSEEIPEKLAYVGIRAHDFVPVNPERKHLINQIYIELREEVYSPFERTLILGNQNHSGKGIWMKQDYMDTQIPESIQVQPEKILLLEE